MQKDTRARKGQVLVIVALGLVALVGIVALAVDGGHVYAERRKMQNAADAGALAGARVLCYDETATLAKIRNEATRYAVELNGAQGAEVTVTGSLTVTVVTTETAGTFFARAIGFPEVEVAARASAMCQKPLGAGDIWPLAVMHGVYTDTVTIPCGAPFFAYVDNDEVTTECTLTKLEPMEKSDPSWPPECADAADYPAGFPGVDKVRHLTESQRGWLELFTPAAPLPDPCDGKCNGADGARCWVTSGHPGPIGVNDCLSKEAGTMTTVVKAGGDQVCSIYNLVLFDRACASEIDPSERWFWCNENPAKEKPDSFYHVTGFGCMRVLGSYDAEFDCPWKNKVKAKTLVVQKLCQGVTDFPPNCLTITGEGGGTPSETDPIIIQLTE